MRLITTPWQLADSANTLPDRPLDTLAQGEIPAIVIRGAWSKELCEQLYQKLIAEDLLYDPSKPIPDKFIEASIPEGYYREGLKGIDRRDAQEQIQRAKRRIDIGTSLGYRGSDPEAFFAHATETHRLFEKLFSDFPSPIQLIYDRLQQLSIDKKVTTAYEPDGRKYGPAIIRAHYGGYTYRPHFDSVRHREKREDYAVHRFEHQFAGVLVLKNSEFAGTTAQCILHRTFATEEVQAHLNEITFHEYAQAQNIESVQVCLEPGDLYFFNTGGIHEVPGVDGTEPRVVVATFIGYSHNDNEIFVWS